MRTRLPRGPGGARVRLVPAERARTAGGRKGRAAPCARRRHVVGLRRTRIEPSGGHAAGSVLAHIPGSVARTIRECGGRSTTTPDGATVALTSSRATLGAVGRPSRGRMRRRHRLPVPGPSRARPAGSPHTPPPNSLPQHQLGRPGLLLPRAYRRFFAAAFLGDVFAGLRAAFFGGPLAAFAFFGGASLCARAAHAASARGSS